MEEFLKSRILAYNLLQANAITTAFICAVCRLVMLGILISGNILNKQKYSQSEEKSSSSIFFNVTNFAPNLIENIKSATNFNN